MVIPTANLGGRLYINAACGNGPPSSECSGGFGDPFGYAAVVYLYAADLILEQSAGPSVGATGGELASAATVSGASDITFQASDPGAGIYTAVFTVDGQVVQSTVVDENGGRCRNVGQTTDGLPAFMYVQPCKASLTADVGLDTTRLANGTHHLIVSVVDAAGNSSPVLDRNVTVANPTTVVGSAGGGNGTPQQGTQTAQQGAQAGGATSPGGSTAGTPGAPNGTPASAHPSLALAWAGTRASRLTLSYGKPATVVGRLTDPSGAPIAGARLDVEALPSYVGAASVALAPTTTRPDGRFTIRLAGGGSSRTLRVSYRERIGDPVPIASTSLSLVVRAGVSLLVAPHTTRVGHTIRFEGVLRGGAIPRAGKQVVLEARSPGGSWLEFNVVRANGSGRYRASYRFRFPGPATYQFRAVSENESDYPFAAAASNTVLVRER